MIMTLVVILVVPILSSYTSQGEFDPYPDESGFYHFRDLFTGQLLSKDRFAIVVINGEDKIIQFIDCEEGVHFSCKTGYCVPIGSEEECDCIV